MLLDFLNDMRYRLRALFRRDAFEREMDNELRDHIERASAAFVAQGLSREDALRRARMSLGGVTQVKEAQRDARGLVTIDRLAQDVRYAIRTLRRNPGFTVVAVLSLALGIGANSALFSALDELLLKPLPVESPDELVTLEQTHPDGQRQYNLSFLDYERFKEFDQLSGIAAASWGEVFNVSTLGHREIADGRSTRVTAVTGTYFQLLGVASARGRLLGPADDFDASEPAIVLSDAYWTRRFARAADAIGSTLVLNERAFTVVGVMQPEFTGDWIGWPTDLWVASAHIAALHPETASGNARTRFQYKVLGRLAHGVGLALAQTAGELFYERLQRDPPSNSGISKDARFDLRSAANGYSPQREHFARPLVILMAIVAAVLLIACANLTNLMLARAAAREREIALRVSIGASRKRIVRQLMTESVILAFVGGLFGLGAAIVGMDFLSGMVRWGPLASLASGANPISLDLHLDVDRRVLLFTAITCVVTSLAVGLAPAVRGSRVNLLRALGVGGRPINAPARAVGRATLVICQVALSLVLLIGTGLFVRTLRNLKTQPLGFDRERILLVSTLPGQTGKQPRQIAALWQSAQERIGAIPGVLSVGVSIEGLLSDGPAGGPLLSVEGQPLEDSVRVQSTMTVAPKFFATIGQRLVEGRDFLTTDTDSTQPVVILNESLARRLFHGESAIGRRVQIRGGVLLEVVGVVADAKRAPRVAIGPAAYYPPMQNLRRLPRGMVVVLRTSSDPSAVAASTREALRSLDPNLPVLAVNTMDEQLDRALFQDRLVAEISIAFGSLALILACVGLYGLVSYLSSKRTQEVGIKMALGATRSGVLRAIMLQSMRLVLAGVAIGILATVWMSRGIASLLYGLNAFDALTVAGSALLLLTCAAVAAFLPAFRASSVDPIVALRQD